MKNLLAGIFLLLLPVLWASAQAPSTYTLVSDPLDVRAEWVSVEIDGVVAPECSAGAPCIVDDALAYDVTSRVIAGTLFSVRARACRVDSIGRDSCSAWSAAVPFDFFAPAGVTGLSIAES